MEISGTFAGFSILVVARPLARWQDVRVSTHFFCKWFSFQPLYFGLLVLNSISRFLIRHSIICYSADLKH